MGTITEVEKLLKHLVEVELAEMLPHSKGDMVTVLLDRFSVYVDENEHGLAVYAKVLGSKKAVLVRVEEYAEEWLES